MLITETVKSGEKPVTGDYRIGYCFAWFPTYVNDRLIWLRRYQHLYEYTVRLRALPYFRGMDKVYYANVGAWDLISTKIL